MMSIFSWIFWIVSLLSKYMISSWSTRKPQISELSRTSNLFLTLYVVTLRRPSQTSESHLFALLIGINDYKNNGMHKLQGAVPDAYAVREYLHDMLRTEYEHIKVLKDKDATKDGIIRAIKDLSNNIQIQKDDAILIYFSGHGSVGSAPNQWKDFCQQIELIVPYDGDIDTGGNLIADRELAHHLRELATAKGDNITVILDCCHSGSGTRAGESNDSDGSIIRGVQTSAPILLDPDHEIFAEDLSQPQVLEREGFMAEGFSAYSGTSHVLLAACKQDEKARENGGQGVFTKALLEALRSYSVDVHHVTYKDLIAGIGPLKSQHPQCEGQNTSRIIFGGKTPHIAKYLHDVEYYNNTNRYTMKAGKVHGICAGAQYQLFKDRASIGANKPIGAMEAIDVQDTTTILKPLAPDSQITEKIAEHIGKKRLSLLALQISPSKDEILPIYAAKDDKIYPKLQSLMSSDKAARPWQIRLVDLDHRETAFIGLSLDEDNQVSIKILDKECCSHGMTRITRKLELNPDLIDSDDDHNLSNFLESVAFFRRHLKRVHGPSIIKNKIEIEFSELVPSENEDENSLLRQYEPKKDVVDGKEVVVNLIRDDKIVLDIPGNFVEDGYIKTPERYGITIRNSASVPLYASVFFFSVGNFEIVPYYESPLAGLGKNSIQPSIPADGALPIGYGPDGQPAWQYGMDTTDEIDLGFLKFFISTEPVQLSHLVQKSAFDRVRGGSPVYPELSRSWAVITIPLIQNRVPTNESSNSS